MTPLINNNVKSVGMGPKDVEFLSPGILAMGNELGGTASRLKT